MKILLDEDVLAKLARFVGPHEIHIVSMQWSGVKNGTLPRLIERERSDVFLTGDKRMDKQQRLSGRGFAVLILSAINWPVVRPHVDRILAAVDDAESGTVMTIDCGVFIPRVNRPGN